MNEDSRARGSFGVGVSRFALPGGFRRWWPFFLLSVKRQKRVPFRTAGSAPGPLPEKEKNEDHHEQQTQENGYQEDTHFQD